MAITVDVANLGNRIGSGTTGSITVTTTSAVAAGGFIVLYTMTLGSTARLTGVSGSGLSWTVDAQDLSSSAGGIRTGIARAFAPSGLVTNTVLTPTFDTADPGIFYSFGTMSLLGVKTTSPLDVVDSPDHSPSAAGFGPSATAWNGNSKTIQAGSILITGAMSGDSNLGSTPTSPSIEAWDNFNAGGFAGTVVYRIEAAGGTFQNAGTFNGTAGNIQAATAAYLAEPSSSAAGVMWVGTL